MQDSQRLWLMSIVIRGNTEKRQVCYFRDCYKNINRVGLLPLKTPTTSIQQKFSFDYNTVWPMKFFIPFLMGNFQL